MNSIFHFTKEMNTIRIGLLGFGNVGGGAFQILLMNKDIIEKSCGKHLIVSRVLARDKNKDRGFEFDHSIITSNVDDIINDPEIDIIAEAIGGIEPATSYILRALEAGKNVVTANKAALAANYDKIINTAKEHNARFRFEASVAAGIPILNAIDTVLRGNQFTEIMGIVNGTTNYILTKMSDERMSYDAALKQAQEKGFAEADPTADVEGIDVANKLTILMALTFGHYVKPENIPTIGISKITPNDIELAKQQGCRIKLIAHAKIENDKLVYEVKPLSLPNSHPLASVNNEFNAVFITGNAVGELMFYGRGAGPLPTGSGVVGDIMEIAKVL